MLFLQGTQLYDPKAGGWRDLGMLDVMQARDKIFHPELIWNYYKVVIFHNLFQLFSSYFWYRYLDVLEDLSLTKVVKAS